MFNRNLGIRCLAKDHDIELCMAVNYREGEVDPPHPKVDKTRWDETSFSGQDKDQEISQD